MNELDNDGKSPIYYAAKSEDLSMMEELLNHSCKLTKDAVIYLAKNRKGNGFYQFDGEVASLKFRL